MAGEYSRELSVKVFAGQSHLIRLGYRQGGTPGYGLRRLLVDEMGVSKGELGSGERKSIATDRVLLVPGPPEEIAIVNEIYHRFVHNGTSESELAETLNKRGILSDHHRLWTRATIHQLLINEKYVGNNVWARTSGKLKQARIRNAPDQWVRHDGAFKPLVDRGLFDKAQVIIASRSERMSDEQMLGILKRILDQKGQLSGLIIDECEGCPSSSSFRNRFGSLLRAYSLVGFSPDHDYRYLEINRALRRLHMAIVVDVLEGIRRAGGTVVKHAESDLLTINNEFTASLVVARCRATARGSLRWIIRLDTALNADITVAVRMDPGNARALDYYLLPRFDLRDAFLRLCEYNGLSLDAYRFDNLDVLHRMAMRAPMRRAA